MEGLKVGDVFVLYNVREMTNNVKRWLTENERQTFIGHSEFGNKVRIRHRERGLSFQFDTMEDVKPVAGLTITKLK